MKFISIAYLSLFIFYTFFSSCTDSAPIPAYDLIITNGKIIDGTGGAPYDGHIFIQGDSIVAINSELSPLLPDSILYDAQGQIITPGFIDLHAHGNPLQTPDFQNFTAMGVTTIVLGQDGSSPAYANLADWQKEIQQQGIGLNIATFIGHGTLREMTDINSTPIGTTQQMDSMKTLLRNNLAVCFGMSTGLEYAPGLYAEADEMIALAKIVGEQNRLIMSHIRNEDDDQIAKSLQELLEQGEHARVHVSHLKVVYGKGAERAEQILDLLQTARNAGVEVTADVYPYNASSTGIGIVFPKWSKTDAQFKQIKNTRRAELLAFLRQKVTRRNGPAATLLGTAPYTGKTLADLETERGKPFEEILVDEIGPQGASGAYFVMNEALQSRLLQDSLVGICSDGSPTMHHPRGYGTFAKIIETYVQQEQLFSLETAIYKTTGLAADILSINNRGRIAEGMKADLVIFNPDEVRATATYDNPKQLATGFNTVIVNGKFVRKKGTFTDERNGQILLPD
ncbi:MAG: amidohydrolase family protein [Saprospiraceae bacterium]